MAAAVKHARIDEGVSSPVPAAKSGFLQTGQTTGAQARKKSISLQGDAGGSAGNKQGPTMSRLDSLNVGSPNPEAMKMRRRSTFKGMKQGVTNTLLNLRRMTKGSMDKEMHAAALAAAQASSAKPKVRLENTYRMSPDQKEVFSACKAESILHELLEANLKEQKYTPQRAPQMAAVLTEKLKAGVKGLHAERHKLVVSVVVGPVGEQGMQVVSRCLWDTGTDTSATVTYNNGSIFAIATVYAVYYE